MPTIALITDEQRGTTHDDAELLPALARAGVQAEFVAWDTPTDWRRFHAAVVRTPWDYHERFSSFAAWLDRLDGLGVPLWNPSAVVRWNARKTYLIELATAGLPVIPTAPLGSAGLASHVARWGRVVVKPEIGGGGAFTRTADRHTHRDVEALLGDRPYLVQPFDPRVADGEWSLIYFDGAFSHAVMKRARPGEFLIHEEHGGSVEPATAPLALRGVADRFANYRGVLPYARVDLLGSGADAALVELELIEPELFFRFSADGPDRFANAVAARVRALDTRPSAP